MVCRTEDRITNLRKMCKTHNIDTYSPQFKHVYVRVNHKNKYIVCLPQKAGCTTWKIILANNSSPDPLSAEFNGDQLHGDGLEKYGIYSLNDYSPLQQQEILEDPQYYKFMVVRHPLDRLVSAHNDKIILTDNNLAKKRRKEILDLHFKNHGKASNDLQAFIEYILERKSYWNRHWAPVAALCDSCNIKYDKIGKLETQNDDLLDVISHLGPYYRMKNVHANHKGSGAAHSFSWNISIFSGVSEELFRRLLHMGFEQDMKLFGYTWSNVSAVRGLDVQCSSETNCC